MFQDLAKDTGKGNGTVVYSLGFVTFFEHLGDKSMTPVCGEFSSFNGPVLLGKSPLVTPLGPMV